MRKFTLLMLFATLATYSLHAQSNYLGVDNRDGVASSNKKVFTEGLITKQNNTKSRLKVSGLFTETFSSGTLPAGWTNTDNTGNSAGTWAFDNPGGRGINTTTGASGFAIFDSDALGSDGLAEDADLISPAIDCSSLSTVILSFEHYYYGYSNSVAEVFVSGDNGATWTSLEAWGTTSTTNAALAKYDVSSVAAGQSQVKIRWNFQGNWAWYWAIDDVIVGEPTIHDLAVQSINNSSALFTGVAPIVAIKNTGEFPEGAYSVTLSDGENYNETIDVTENVLLGNTYFVTFPNFTSLIEGENYTLTATLSCPDDTNPGNDELTTQVTASQNASDLGISSINVASELISGVVVSPTVTILNSGNSEVMVYSVFLTDGATYSETVNVTTALATGNEYDVTFPDWTPATGNYTLTARVTSAGDMNGHNNSLDKNVIVSDGEHDLSVISVPNAVASGTTTALYVNVLNIGNYSEASFSVSLSNGSDYNETVNVTTSIAVGESFKVTFPDWTPADGTYTLTATITLTDDVNTDNNTLTQECKTVTERIAYVSRYNGGSLNGTLNIPFDNFTEIGMSSVQIQSLGWKDNVLYAISSTGQFGSINTADGSFTLIGNTGISANYFTSLVCDPITGQMYVTTLTGGYPGFDVGLYAIDQQTGTGTLVATSPQNGTFSQFAFNGEGQLYSIEHRPGENGLLYAIDKTTAAMTLIGDLGAVVSANFQPMSWDVYNEVMYFQASMGSSGNMQGSYVINLSTGAATLVGTPYASQVLAMVLPFWDANLQNLTVDGTAIKDFSPGVYDYNVVLPSGTTVLPVLGATAFYASASTVITDVSALPGSATVVVTPTEGASNTYTINFSVATITDASLSDLKVNGTTVEGFDPATLVYNVELPVVTTMVPTVTATVTDANAIPLTTDATALPGATTVEVTAADLTTKQTYTINFTFSPDNDAALSDLMVDGATVADFDPETLTYDVVLPSGTITVPTVTATTNNAYATTLITDATALPGATAVEVTASDGSTKQTYTINFTVIATTDASLSDLKVNGTTVEGFDPATLTYTVAYALGTSSVPTVTATTYDANANSLITDATALPGATTVEVTAADGITKVTYTINFPANTDATLSDLMVDGATVADFDPETLTYDVVFPSGTIAIPAVTVTTNDANATELITDATSLPGAATVEVTADDGSTQQTYTINFNVAANTDARLSDLMVSGTRVDGFDPATLTYDIVMPSGTSVIPLVTATAYDGNATKIITNATALPGTTTVEVTAADGSTKQTYTINFTVTAIDDATLADLKVDGETVPGFAPTTYAYDIELPFGTTIVPVVSATTNDARALITEINETASLPGASIVNVEANDGVTKLSYTVNFTVYDSIPVLTIVDPAAECGSVDITSTLVIIGNTNGGTLSYWEDATANTSPIVDATAVTASGTYYIKSSNTYGSDIEAVNVTVNPIPQQPIIADNVVVDGSKTICPNDEIVCSNFDATYSYQWMLNGNEISGQNSSEYIVPGTGAGVYLLTVVNDVTFCSNVSEPLTINVHSVETPTILEKKEDGIISILVVDNSNNQYVNYLWTYADGTDLPSGMPNDRQFLTLQASAMNGQYMVQATDINGCTIISAPRIVTLKCLNSKVFPTINNGSFTIELVGEQTGRVKVDIYNQSGVALKNYVYEKQDNAGSFQVIGAGLSAGSYNVIITIDNVRKIHKIIVQ